MTTKTSVLFLLSVGLAVARIAGIHHPAFQAVAHLFVGGLLAAGWRGNSVATLRTPETRLAVVLSVIETICFFTLSRSTAVFHF